jgi:hypothetical protein
MEVGCGLATAAFTVTSARHESRPAQQHAPVLKVLGTDDSR